ncbi:protein takeout-like [Rhagoletis pomonella]|uniref:protein takeout-like n=2 Tax=Rhagoletis pomonella TaxID=28610 RepID=UPI00177E6304|nr:protein takeout-like [Rhagoletis pomonella]
MFKFFSMLLGLVPFLALQVLAGFPNDPKPCQYGDRACLMSTIEYLMHNKSQGFASLNLVKTEPLRVAKMVMKQGAESPVNIDLTFINNDITGYSRIKMKDVKGFGKDLGTKHDLYAVAPVLSMIGDYTIKGRVLVLPITGTGKSNITMVNVRIHIRFTGVPMEKPDGLYMKVKDVRLDVQPDKMIFNFDNLFNGDKMLGETMNGFLNENWKDIYHEVRDSFNEAFAQIFTTVIDTVFSKYPYERYFTE